MNDPITLFFRLLLMWQVVERIFLTRADLMNQRYFSLPMLWLLLWQTSVQAASEEQLDVIRELGRLNGIALVCDGISDTQRIKRALVSNLPKRRQLGELFDYATNQAYMAFVQEQASCPESRSLASQIDEQLTRLEAAYKSQ